MGALNLAPTEAEIATYPRDRRRFRKIVLFFTLNFLRSIYWELILARLFGAKFAARGREERMRAWARRFRALAIELGGVMIKLGQFISTRVDILPESVIQELADLQDEVPAAPFEAVQTVLWEELGHRYDDLDDINLQPIAAASLGQVYRASLKGENVVIKAQRPGIRALVYTDLAALAVVARRAMRFKFISKRADMPALLEEFGAVLWEELDYISEANNAEQFRQMFAGVDDVYIPHFYTDYCSRRVLIIQDVAAIKINDYRALELAGVNRGAVAQRLLDTYLTQVFRSHFFHADPHPGNIFIRPLRAEEILAAKSAGKRFDGSPLAGRPFQIIFVDYGMMGRLDARLVEALRQTLVAVGLRDARGLVEAYDALGILMPGADKERIIQATRAAFDMVWGLRIEEMTDLSADELKAFGGEFKDLLFAAPFRVPQDLIYLGRCAGILSGMCTGLDPYFDPWVEMQPYVRELVQGKREASADNGHYPLTDALKEWLNLENFRALISAENFELALKTGGDYGARALQLPILADEVLRRADRGDLQMRLRLDDDLRKRIENIERGNQRTAFALTFVALVIGGAILWISDAQTLGGGALVLAGLTWLRVMLF